MWFVFPQLFGLGSSTMAMRYGIRSIGEAQAYLQNQILGPRLVECTQAVFVLNDLSAKEIFGTLDYAVTPE